MEVSNTVTAGIHEEILEASYAKFWKFAKENFQFEAKSSIEYLTRIKESVKFFHLEVPAHLNEVFVRMDESPLFWIYDSPLVQYLEDMLKIHLGKSNDFENYKSIKDFYTKWIVIKSENEKRYFANSAVSAIEKSTSKYNYFFLILKGVLYTFEKSMFSAETAIELFNRSLDLVATTKVSENYKDELQYSIHLFSGFAHFRQKNLEQAKLQFQAAINIKSYGVTAKFYLALAEIQSAQYETAAILVKDLYQYDVARLTYALNKNSAGMFKYFVNNSVGYNLFYHKEFAAIIDQIEIDFCSLLLPGSAISSQLSGKLSKLKELKMDEYYNDETINTLTFIEKFIDQFYDSRNLLVLSSIQTLVQKLDAIVKSIYELMKQKHNNEIKNKLKIFDEQLQEKRYSITLLTNDFEALKVKQKDKLAAALKEIETKIEEYIKIIEAKITSIPLENRHDPVHSFKNMMTYNVVISSLLFLIGGCSGYSTQYLRGGMDFKAVLAELILAGLKWGLATFLIGFILSLVVALSTLVSRTTHKQKLTQKINWLKNQKELEINNTKKENDQKEKLLKENYDDRIADLKHKIDELIKERSSLEVETKQEVEEKLKKESAPLLALLTPEIVPQLN